MRSVLEWISRTCKLQSLSPIRKLHQAYRVDDIWASPFWFVRFQVHFLPSRQSSNFRLRNGPKSQKTISRNVFSSGLILFGIPSGIALLYISQLPESSYFETRIMRNACFSYTRPSILASKNSIQKSFFPKHIPGQPFWWFCWLKTKTTDLGTPSKSSGRQNPPTPGGVRLCQIRECSAS